MRTPAGQVQPAVCSYGSPHLLQSLLWGQETGGVKFQNTWNFPTTQCLSLCLSVSVSLPLSLSFVYAALSAWNILSLPYLWENSYLIFKTLFRYSLFYEISP